MGEKSLQTLLPSNRSAVRSDNKIIFLHYGKWLTPRREHCVVRAIDRLRPQTPSIDSINSFFSSPATNFSLPPHPISSPYLTTCVAGKFSWIYTCCERRFSSMCFDPRADSVSTAILPVQYDEQTFTTDVSPVGSLFQVAGKPPPIRLLLKRWRILNRVTLPRFRCLATPTLHRCAFPLASARSLRKKRQWPSSLHL